MPVNTDGLLREGEAAEVLGLLSQQTLSLWRAKSAGPPYIRVGVRAIRYRRSDLDSWLEQRTVRPEAAVGG